MGSSVFVPLLPIPSACLLSAGVLFLLNQEQRSRCASRGCIHYGACCPARLHPHTAWCVAACPQPGSQGPWRSPSPSKVYRSSNAVRAIASAPAVVA